MLAPGRRPRYRHTDYTDCGLRVNCHAQVGRPEQRFVSGLNGDPATRWFG